jgi:hypothetical protein
MILPTARTSMIPTVTVPRQRVLKVARFSYADDASVELVAPVAASIRPATATSQAATVRPARKVR